MTSSDRYNEVLVARFQRRFGVAIVIERDGLDTHITRTDGKTLGKKQVAYLDGFNNAFWVLHGDVQYNEMIAKAITDRCLHAVKRGLAAEKTKAGKVALNRAIHRILSDVWSFIPKEVTK